MRKGPERNALTCTMHDGDGTYSNLFLDGLEEGIVRGKISQNFLVLGEVDEDGESIMGNLLTKVSCQFRC